KARGVEQRDGGAVAVPDQDRPLDPAGRQQLGERRMPLDLEVVVGPRQDERLGSAEAPSVVDERRQSGGLGKVGRAVAPLPAGTQAFVQEDELDAAGTRRTRNQALEEESVAGGRERAGFAADGHDSGGELSAAARR